MNKRAAKRVAKDLCDLADKLRFDVDHQLTAGAWYFERQSEIKGFNFSWAAYENALFIAAQIKKRLRAATREYDVHERRARRLREARNKRRREKRRKS